MLAYTQTQIKASVAAVELLRVQEKQILGQQAIDGLRAKGLSESLRLEESQKRYNEDNKNALRVERERIALAIARFGIMQELLALELSFNDAIAESREAMLQRDRQESASLTKQRDSLANRLRDTKDELINDDSDYDRAVKAEERLGQMRIDMLRMSGDEEAALVEDGERRKRDAKMELLRLGITDKRAIDQELAMIDKETQTAISANERTVAQARADEMLVYADAVSAGLGAIFGENKAVQSAQVVIDTIAGANKAFAGLMPNFPLAVAAAASVTAQGISALRKINSSTKNSKSLGGSKSASAPISSTRQPQPFFGTVNATEMASTVSPRNTPAPVLILQGDLDSELLAIKVRQGSDSLSSRGVSVVSA
jgi:hypothetical protein